MYFLSFRAQIATLTTEYLDVRELMRAPAYMRSFQLFLLPLHLSSFSVPGAFRYDAYSMKTCKPAGGIVPAAENLGEHLTGEAIENSPYDVRPALV